MRFVKLIPQRGFLLVFLCLALAGLSGCVSSAVNAGVAVVKAPFEFGMAVVKPPVEAVAGMVKAPLDLGLSVAKVPLDAGSTLAGYSAEMVEAGANIGAIGAKGASVMGLTTVGIKVEQT